MYTQEQIDEFKAKADKWDELDAKMDEMFSENNEEFDMFSVAMLVTEAFGYA